MVSKPIHHHADMHAYQVKRPDEGNYQEAGKTVDDRVATNKRVVVR